jgi:hypothetical protein
MAARIRLALGLLASLSLCAGCANVTKFVDQLSPGPTDTGPTTGDALLAGVRELRIIPPDTVLTVVDSNPVTQAYKCMGKLADGTERDVTAKTSFSTDNPRLGVFSGGVFTTAIDRGGKTTVTAEAGTLTATTSLTVLFQRRFLGKDVPSDVEASFGKAPVNAGRSPEIAYPPDEVLLPPNLLELEFQWVAGSGNDLFELSLKNDGTDIRFYTRCNTVGSGCGLVPDATAWAALVGAIKGGDAAVVMVRGTDSASFAGVGTSTTRVMRVASEEIQGGLFYWNATSIATQIVRYDFGKPNQKANVFLSTIDPFNCVGCHVMSRDGTRIAVGSGMPAPAAVKILDVATRDLISSGGANFMTFSPDSKLIITSNGNSLVLNDVATATPIAPNPLVALGTMPDWSADGTMVVYSAPKTGIPIFGTPGIDEGSLQLMYYDATKQSWSVSKTLVKSNGENNYYPTFSPDNKFIAFNRAAGNSYDSPKSQDNPNPPPRSLWMVKADGTGQPFPLTLANGGKDAINSWPKFSPFIQNYRTGKLMWLTFSSRRDYGLRVVGQERAQIWMAAIDPSKSEMATDPSHAAFWLPFQEIGTGNHIAQWVSTMVHKPCVKDEDCPGGEFCKNNQCGPKGVD